MWISLRGGPCRLRGLKISLRSTLLLVGHLFEIWALFPNQDIVHIEHSNNRHCGFVPLQMSYGVDKYVWLEGRVCSFASVFCFPILVFIVNRSVYSSISRYSAHCYQSFDCTTEIHNRLKPSKGLVPVILATMQYQLPSDPLQFIDTSSEDFKILGAADQLRAVSPRSIRPMPVFTSSFGSPKAPMYIFTGTSASGESPANFGPNLYSQRLRPIAPCSGLNHATSTFDQTRGFPALETKGVDPTLPVYESNGQRTSESFNRQYDLFNASINRLLYGQEPFSSNQAIGGAIDVKDRRMDIGKILDGQPTRRLSVGPMGGIKCEPEDKTVTPANRGQHPRFSVRPIGQGRVKREAEIEAPPPAKRRRYGGRPDHDMMSSIERTGKKYYGGSNLERFAFTDKEHYTAIKRLGAGSEGTAHLVKNQRSGAVVVCKVIPHLKNHNHAESELFFLRDALHRHARIINLQSALISPSQTELYLDYCDGGDMATFIEANHWKLDGAYIPEAFMWHAFLQLTEALAFIHYGFDRNAPFAVSGRPELPEQWFSVIHRDIKPTNILLQRAPANPDHPGPEPYPRLVLADFGLALQAAEVNTLPTSNYSIGTYIYQPPECPLHSPKGDVWSIGATIFEMCMGRVPFDVDEKPEWAEENADAFREWCCLLTRRELEDMFRITGQGYSRELQRCLVGALELSVEWRMSSLELMRMVECSRGRKEAVWEELHPLVFEGMQRG